MNTLLLGKNHVLELMEMSAVLTAVEESFVLLAEGKAQMPAKTYLCLPEGDFRAMPAFLPGSAGVKWVNVHPSNYRHNLPTIMAVMIYSDPDTGFPLAIMDATAITAFRTGAAAAVASKYMALPNPRTLGILGAGRQAYTQLEAHVELFNFTEILVHDLNTENAQKLVECYPLLPVKLAGIRSVCACSIVCTTTPSRSPVINADWINPGTHINAVGADAPGKQELDERILLSSRVVVDDFEQAVKSGEINVSIAHGTFKPENISASLSEIISGKKPGRSSAGEVTVFDSTGIAIQDIAVAKVIYEKAISGKLGSYPEFNLVM